MPACSTCATENPAGARFCMSCGATLERRCATCGEPVPEGARFCMACGSPWAADGGGRDAAAQPAAAIDVDQPSVALAAPTLDERRTVTVLFADLSGYTAVAARLDPESVKRQLDRILGRLGEEVVAFGGHVDKFIGDNVMAIFGAPLAHGDDAGTRGARGARHAGGDGRDQRAAGRAARRHLRAVRGDQHRRGARGLRRRQLHGDRRHRQRRGEAAGGGASGQRDRR